MSLLLLAPANALGSFSGANGSFSYGLPDTLFGDLHGITASNETTWLAEGRDLSWSSDGREMIYAGRNGIVLYRPDTGYRVNLTTNPNDRDPAVSYAGDLLAFERNGGIWTVDLNGRGERLLVAGRDPVWHPKDLRLAYSDGGIRTIDASGLNYRSIVDYTRPEGIEQFDAPDWSPDGGSLTYSQETMKQGGLIHVVDVATRQTRQIGTFRSHFGYCGAVIGNPVWSPDGTRVAFFQSELEPDYCNVHLVTVAPDGSDWRPIVNLGHLKKPTSLQWRAVNRPPAASITASPLSPLTGEAVTLRATVSDPDGPLRGVMRWDVDGDGFDDGDGASITTTFAKPGNQTILFEVGDNHRVRFAFTHRLTVRALPAIESKDRPETPKPPTTPGRGGDSAGGQPADGSGAASGQHGSTPPDSSTAILRLRRVSRPSLALALRRGLGVAVTLSTPGRVNASMRLRGRDAARLKLPLLAARGSVVVKRAGRARVVLRFTRTARQRLSRLAAIKLIVRLEAGSSTPVARTITLKR